MSNDKKTTVPAVTAAAGMSFANFLTGGMPLLPTQPRPAVAVASATLPLGEPAAKL